MSHCSTLPGALGSVDHTNIYEEWLASKEVWKHSRWACELQRSQSITRIGARRWMTEEQILERYKDAKVVDEIVANKMSEKECNMPHPDAPNCKVGFSVMSFACTSGR